MPLRMLMVHPGASYSTHDVHRGYDKAFRKLGAEVISYALDSRIEVSGRFLNMLQQEYNARSPDTPMSEPTSSDILLYAGEQVIHKALRHNVDFVFVTSAMYLHPDIVIMLKRAGIKVGILFTESPYDDDKQIPLASIVDICWTNELRSVDVLRQYNKMTSYVRHCFDPDIHKPREVDEAFPFHDVLFVGTGFRERVETLSKVDWSKWLSMPLALYGEWELAQGTILEDMGAIKGSSIDNEITAKLYANCTVGLNLFRRSIGFGSDAPLIDKDAAVSVGPRTIELAACGTFQISEYREEVYSIFDSSIPTFETSEQLEDLLSDFTNPSAERKALRTRYASAAMVRVQNETFNHRAKDILSLIDHVVSSFSM